MKKIFIIHENNEWVEPLLIHLSNLQAPIGGSLKVLIQT
jgi:hypothetical protein